MSSKEKQNETLSKEEKGITVKKSQDFSEWFTQVTQKAELADMRYGVQGFIVHMPWAVWIARKIYEYLEAEVEADAHQPVLFPTAIPEENLKREEEHAGFVPEVFWITHAGTEKLDRKLALRPTGETQIYPLYSLWIRSFKDLPFKRYQSRITVFRNEMQTRPFLRGREFMFFETHDAFASHEDAMKQIYKDMEIMTNVMNKKLLLPFIFFKRPQWDKFKGADDTYSSDTLQPDGKRTQISSTHDLGTNFAEAFNIKFTDKDGQEKFAHQTCFGPGIWRSIAALIAIHGDDQGLVLPFDVAPVQIAIVPIVFAGKEDESKTILEYCKKLEKTIKELNYRVHLDDRDNITPGEKYNIWELKGVPLRFEIGPREVAYKTVTIVRRTDKKKESIETGTNTLQKEIKLQSQLSDKQIKQKAEEYFQHSTKPAETLDEIKHMIEKHRGFIKAPFCSMDWEGQECAEAIKAQTTAVVCGTPLEEEKPHGDARCAVCRKPAKHIAYIAKSI